MDDNDGVFFFSGLEPGVEALLGIEAHQLSVSPAYLNAWMDFNDDGDWDDAGEQIFLDERLDEGLNARTILVPASAARTEVAARFRWTLERGISPFADAIAGETEDYDVMIPSGPMSGIRAVDDPSPGESISVDEDQSILIDVLANDDPGPLGGVIVIESTTDPDHGSASVVDGKVQYEPMTISSGRTHLITRSSTPLESAPWRP